MLVSREKLSMQRGGYKNCNLCSSRRQGSKVVRGIVLQCAFGYPKTASKYPPLFQKYSRRGGAGREAWTSEYAIPLFPEHEDALLVAPSRSPLRNASQEWDKVVSTFVLRAAIGPAAPPVPPKKNGATGAGHAGSGSSSSQGWSSNC